MNIIFKSIRSSLTILFLFNILLSACEDQVIVIENNEEVILPALRERSETKFSNSTRDFYSIFSDSSSFNTTYPGTNKSCGYIIRYYFYTNIFIDKDQNILISMDRSRFNVSSNNDVIGQTKNIIEQIRNMSFGNQEYQEFINNYPNLK